MIEHIAESLPCIVGFIVLTGIFVGFCRFLVGGMQKTLDRNTEVMASVKTLIQAKVR